MRKTISGFTIVELLIVIVVIVILASITIVSYNSVNNKARTTAKINDITSIQNLVERYASEKGSYPSTGGAWKYQRRDGDAFIPGLTPEYASSLPSITDDPTNNLINNTYIYKSDGTNYKLDRLYQPSVPSGEFSNIPSDMKDNTYTDRWGVWSSGGTGF
ncbi:fimbrial protein pilin [Candidatus Saccharibacteria bacterium RAAC3_TM7_1]|nr:fimbrial protein pilin [Candidatus Saccharibacteria bacterium RAAC3_TM7_1]HCZ28625.1 prepilin-type N-terminal cleavage/methylation domain-containing protein [Candidatus Saccharibacteria bacterium]